MLIASPSQTLKLPETGNINHGNLVQAQTSLFIYINLTRASSRKTVWYCIRSICCACAKLPPVWSFHQARGKQTGKKQLFLSVLFMKSVSMRDTDWTQQEVTVVLLWEKKVEAYYYLLSHKLHQDRELWASTELVLKNNTKCKLHKKLLKSSV